MLGSQGSIWSHFCSPVGSACPTSWMPAGWWWQPTLRPESRRICSPAPRCVGGWGLDSARKAQRPPGRLPRPRLDGDLHAPGGDGPCDGAPCGCGCKSSCCSQSHWVRRPSGRLDIAILFSRLFHNWTVYSGIKKTELEYRKKSSFKYLKLQQIVHLFQWCQNYWFFCQTFAKPLVIRNLKEISIRKVCRKLKLETQFVVGFTGIRSYLKSSP